MTEQTNENSKNNKTQMSWNNIEKIGLWMRKMYQGSIVCKGKFKTRNRDLHSGWFYWIEVISDTGEQKKIEKQSFKWTVSLSLL